jgi:phage-related protein
MAAIWGTDVPTAMDAINKGLVGSTKSLTQFGVKISANEIDARAMSKGYVDASGKVTDAGKAIAAQELILEKTSNVQGAYADNSKDLGSQQDILKAKFENLQAGLGAGLLPIITKVMEVAQPILDFIMQNIDVLGPLALGIGAVTAAMWLWNAAMAANPITLVVIAIAALVAGIAIAYQKVDWFHNLIQTLWEGIQAGYHWIVDNWPLLLAILTGPIGAAVLVITKNWDTIKDGFQTAVDWIEKAAGTVWDIITWPFRHAVDLVKQIIDEIPGVFRTAVSGITTALSTVWTVIKKPFEDGWDAAKKAGKTVIDWFGTIWNTINNAFSGLSDVITYPFRIAFDAIKRLWNSTVGGFGFKVPDWVPGVGGKEFKIPKMATGGIVTRPMIAMIGERGPEAVIPLDQMGTMGPSNAPTVININVYALDATAQTGRRVYDSLREYARISGNQLVIG